MRDHGIHEATYLPDAARERVELAVVRPREARPSCKRRLACGGPAQREEVARGFRAGDPWERVVDRIVGTRR